MRVDLSERWISYSPEGEEETTFWVRSHYCTHLQDQIIDALAGCVSSFFEREQGSDELFEQILSFSGIVVQQGSNLWALSAYHGLCPLYVDIENNVVSDEWERLSKTARYSREVISSLCRQAFIPGTQTIDHQVIKLIDGDLWVLEDGLTSISKRYLKLTFSSKRHSADHDLLEELDKLMTDVLADLKVRCMGKTIFLSLSGGRDSILLAFLLKKADIDFVCFTYGKSGNKELINARQAAKMLGLKHEFIETSNFGSSVDIFIKSQGWRVPIFNGHDSVIRLCNREDKDVVIVDGQTGDWLSGGHLKWGKSETATFEACAIEHLCDQSLDGTWDEATYPIGSIFPAPSTYSEFFNSCEDRTKSYYFDYFIEMHIRQTHCVNPSMRALESAKVTIESPFWDRRLIKWFASLKIHHLKDQAIYSEYTRVYFPEFFETFEQKRRRNVSLSLRFFQRLCSWVLPGKFSAMIRHLCVYFSHYGDQVKGFSLLAWTRLLNNYPFISEGRTVVQIQAGRLLSELQNDH